MLILLSRFLYSHGKYFSLMGLYCSFVMEYDVHTVLDLATLEATIWVIYMMRFNLNASYMHKKDNVLNYYVVIPCALLSLVVHPTTQHHNVKRILWAFCVYMEAVSVLPHLRVMQNTKIVEPFTSHYVFALGVARFLSCSNRILQVIPCALLSLVVHPTTQHHIVNKILWAFCVYMEALSVFPQLRVMQNPRFIAATLHHCCFTESLRPIQCHCV